MGTSAIATGERIAGPERASAAMLDVLTVASILSCSTRHVRRLSDSGRMPMPKKLGSLTRWNRSEIESWLSNGCPSVRASKGGA